MPYMEAYLKAFLKRNNGNPNIRVTTLCKTKEGGDAEALYLGCLNGKSKIRAVITARHHACEMIASHAPLLRGDPLTRQVVIVPKSGSGKLADSPSAGLGVLDYYAKDFFMKTS